MRPASPGGRTRCSRPASSRSPACSSRPARSSGSRRRSPRRTAGAARKWSSATCAPSTARSPGSTGWSCPSRVTTTRESAPVVPASAPAFVRTVTATMMAGRGDELAVSALPADGTYPSGTTKYEKRNISELVAAWDPDLCIQCGNCSFVCPHSVIRSRYYDPSGSTARPTGFALGAAQRSRPPRQPLHAAGLRRGLHRLRPVRRGLPGVGRGRPGAPGDQPRRPRAASGRRT